MADATDSSLQLTRLMDHEDTDPANLGTELRLYLNTIRGLFCEKRCLTIFWLHPNHAGDIEDSNSFSGRDENAGLLDLLWVCQKLCRTHA